MWLLTIFITFIMLYVLANAIFIAAFIASIILWAFAQILVISDRIGEYLYNRFHNKGSGN